MIQLFIATALFGLGVDFLVIGVFKILWMSIYGAIYVGIAATLHNYAQRSSRWRSVSWLILGFFFGGIVLAHLAFKGKVETRNYTMNRVSNSPILLESTDFQDSLLVQSDALQKEIAAHSNSQKTAPVVMEAVKNYGCIETFQVVSIDGIDVATDPQAHWVWKPSTRPISVDAVYSGKQAENERLAWCRVQWF